MKKIFYFLFAFSLLSCAGNDDIFETGNRDLEPAIMWAHLAELPNSSGITAGEYKFAYQKGNLQRMSGKLKTYSGIGGIFDPEPYYTLSYGSNKVTVKFSEDPFTTTVYTMESGKPKKAEVFGYNMVEGINYLQTTKIYTYTPEKIMIYQYLYNKNRESYTSYFFNSNGNLIKSEKLEKSGGVDRIFTTTKYSDFDNAKNPFKKLFLIKDNFYEKSLSANNFRKIESIIQYLPTPDNGNIELPAGINNAHWTYQYDSNGQVILNSPF